MKILSIGNSFSKDAQRYLKGIADAAGEECKCVNLMIGGCTLKTHYDNLFGSRPLYIYEYNGEPLGIYVDIREALVSDEWDIITVHQQSSSSWNFETMRPYLPAIAEEIRKICPRAALYIHQTWADETGAPRAVKGGFSTMEENHVAVRASYRMADELIRADGVIPSGEAMLALCNAGVKAHRDTFHASLGAGRYTLALTWFEKIFGRSCIGNSFRGFDVEMDEELVALCQNIAHKTVEEFK